MSIHRGMNKENVVNTREWYSALKSKEILPFMTTWVGLADILNSEISQSLRTNTKWFLLYGVSKIVKGIEVDNRIVVPRGSGVGKMGSCSMGIQLKSQRSALWHSPMTFLMIKSLILALTYRWTSRRMIQHSVVFKCFIIVSGK